MENNKRLEDEMDRKIHYHGSIALKDDKTGEPIQYDDLPYGAQESVEAYLLDKNSWHDTVMYDDDDGVYDKTAVYDFSCKIYAVDKKDGIWQGEEREIDFNDLPDRLQEDIIYDILRKQNIEHTLVYSDEFSEHGLAAALGNRRFEIQNPTVTVLDEDKVDSVLYGRIDYIHEAEPDRPLKVHINFAYDKASEDVDLYCSSPLGDANPPEYVYDNAEMFEDLVADACYNYQQKQEKEKEQEKAQTAPDKKKQKYRGR